VSAGLVLAAGEGRRFGGPKQLARVGGRPVLERALDALRDVRPRIVVLGARAEEVRAAADLRDARVVLCDDWEEGMAASLRCGIAALGDVDAAVVLLADQPFVTAEAVAAVLAAAEGGHDAVRATYAGIPGHPVLLGRALLSRAAELRGDVGFRAVLEEAEVLGVEAGHLGDPADIDTREQLEALT
jgi:molybdenum cofactor cytidylyltransferase